LRRRARQSKCRAGWRLFSDFRGDDASGTVSPDGGQGHRRAFLVVKPQFGGTEHYAPKRIAQSRDALDKFLR